MRAGFVAYTLMGLLSLVIGVKLLLLWRRTRELPELVLGLRFTGGTLVALFWWIRVMGGPDVDNVLLTLLHRLSAVLAPGFTSFLVWRIFRPTRVWPRWLMGLSLAMLVVFVSQPLVRQGLESWDGLQRGVYWVGYLGMVAPFGWIVWESLRYQVLLRRRTRLGIGDQRLLADRMVLWAIAHASYGLLWVFFSVNSFLVQAGIQIDRDWVSAVLGAIYVSSMWIAFFPPRAYVRRLPAARPRKAS